jgi:hypothetical protein
MRGVYADKPNGKQDAQEVAPANHIFNDSTRKISGRQTFRNDGELRRGSKCGSSN